MPRIPLLTFVLTVAAASSSWAQESISVLEPVSTSDNWIIETGTESEASGTLERPIHMHNSHLPYEVISTEDNQSGTWWSPLNSLKQKLFGQAESNAVYSEDYSRDEPIPGSAQQREMVSSEPLQFVDEESGTTYVVGADGVARPANASLNARQESPSLALTQQYYPHSTPQLSLDTSRQVSQHPMPAPYVPWYAKLNPFRSRSHEVSRSEAWTSPTTGLAASHSPPIPDPGERPTSYGTSTPSSYNVAVTAKNRSENNVKNNQSSYGYSRMPSYDGARSIVATTPNRGEIRPSYQASWQNQPIEPTGNVRRTDSINRLDAYSDNATATASRPIFTNGRFAR